jgi:hypothetical protein
MATAAAPPLHHRQQHREPRPAAGDRRQRARDPAAPGRRGVLLSPGPAAQPRIARRAQLDSVVFQKKLGSLGQDAAHRALAGRAGRDPRRHREQAERAASCARPTWCRTWCSSSRTCRVSPAPTTRAMTARTNRRPTRSPHTTGPAGRRRTAAERRRLAPLPWPTAWIRWWASSASASRRAARRTPLPCAVPRSPCCGSSIEKSLTWICAAAWHAAAAGYPDGVLLEDSEDAVLDYMLDRLPALYEDEGIFQWKYSAPLAPLTAPVAHWTLIGAYALCRRSGERPEAEALAAANKRVATFSARPMTAGRRSEVSATYSMSRRKSAIRALSDAAAQSARCRQRRLHRALASWPPCASPVDAFFDGVMVNAEDPAAARQPPGPAGTCCAASSSPSRISRSSPPDDAPGVATRRGRRQGRRAPAAHREGLRYTAPGGARARAPSTSPGAAWTRVTSLPGWPVPS